MSFRLSPLQFALSVAIAAATLAPFAVKAQSNDLQYLGDTLLLNSQATTSTKTRAEVLAEAREFNKRAVLPDGWRHLDSHAEYVGNPSTKTRAEVLAEAAEFNKRAVLPDGFRHLNNTAEYVGNPSTKTRADVLAEAAEWRKNPLSHDGWFEIGSGHSVYKGLPQPKADMTVAEGK